MTVPPVELGRRELRHKVAALEMILRYVQPLPETGFFCRNVVRVGMTDLLDDLQPLDALSVWLYLRSRLPLCSPGDTCC